MPWSHRWFWLNSMDLKTTAKTKQNKCSKGNYGQYWDNIYTCNIREAEQIIFIYGWIIYVCVYIYMEILGEYINGNIGKYMCVYKYIYLFVYMYIQAKKPWMWETEIRVHVRSWSREREVRRWHIMILKIRLCKTSVILAVILSLEIWNSIKARLLKK